MNYVWPKHTFISEIFHFNQKFTINILISPFFSEDDEDSDTAVQPSGSTSKSEGGPSSTNARGGGSFMQRLFGKRDSGNPELKRTASESSSKKKRKHHWLSLGIFISNNLY